MFSKEQMWSKITTDQDYVAASDIAIQALEEANAFDALHIVGLAMVEMGWFDKARVYLDVSLERHASPVSWYVNAALAFQRQKQYVTAGEYTKRGLELFLDNDRLLYLRGVLCIDQEAFAQAIQWFQITLEKYPHFYHAKSQMAFCYQSLNMFEHAAHCYREVSEVADPKTREESINNLSCILTILGRREEALKVLEDNYPDPASAEVSTSKAFLCLGMGIWPRGWHLFRSRHLTHSTKDSLCQILSHKVPKTLDDIKGKDLFFFHEQGLGDSIQFMRYARLLQPYVKSITLGVPQELVSVALSLNMEKEFLVLPGQRKDDRHEFKFPKDKFDAILPMLDSPAILNQTVDNIPGDPYFLPVEQDFIDGRTLSPLLRGGAKAVGLVWAGGTRTGFQLKSIDGRRSINFQNMKTLIDHYPEIDFVSLQMPDHHVEHDRLIQPLTWDCDMLDTAAVIAQLDLVIAVDTSAAHLAAAFQCPVVLLSRFDQCWRWFWDGRETTPWYPTMRIYQQKRQGEWMEVLERVARDLF